MDTCSVPHSSEVTSPEHLRYGGGGELMGRFYDLVRCEMMDDLTFTYHFTTRLIVHHPSVGAKLFIIFVRTDRIRALLSLCPLFLFGQI